MHRTYIRAAIGLLIGLAASSAQAQTDVIGPIAADTTWVAADAPYRIAGPLVVEAGATLTVEPGVTVQLADAGAIRVEGTLTARGAADAPIVFEGQRRAPGAWQRIEAGEGASITLRHATVRDATHGLFVDRVAAAIDLDDVAFVGYAHTGLWLDTPRDVNLVRVDADGLGEATGQGIYSTAPRLTLTGGVIRRNAIGLSLTSGTVTLTGVVVAGNATHGLDGRPAVGVGQSLRLDRVTIIDNGGWPIRGVARANAPLELRVTRSILEGHDVAIQSATPAYPLRLTGFAESLYAGTALTNVAPPADLGTSLRAAALLADPAGGDYAPTDRSPARHLDPADPRQTIGAVDYAGAPTGEGLYGYYYAHAVFEPDAAYAVRGDVVITPGARITLRPGTTLQVAPDDLLRAGDDPDRVEITVHGTLEADGTASRPITLASAAAAPAAGDWRGITLAADADAFNVSQIAIGHAWRAVTLIERDRELADLRIHDSADTGLYIDGGAVTVERVVIERSGFDGVMVAGPATLAMSDATVRHNTRRGIALRDADLTLTRAVVHDNGDGIDHEDALAGSEALVLDQVIVAHNGRGLRLERGADFDDRTTVALRSSAITHNRIRGLEEYGATFPITWSCDASNIWGNPIDARVDLGDRCFAENPLYADVDARDYEPTRWSPHRGLGVDGATVGPLAHVDAVGPYVMGFIWDDVTLTRDGSPYTLLGDLVVAPGGRLTVEGGVELRCLDRQDQMGGGLDPERVELRFMTGSIGRIGVDQRVADVAERGFDAPPVVIRSTADRPASGGWYGVVSHNGGGVLFNTELVRPVVGVHSIGPRGASVFFTRILHPQQDGIIYDGADAAGYRTVHAARIIGRAHGQGAGVVIKESNVNVTSSYVTHFDAGVRLVNTVPYISHSVHLINDTITRTRVGLEIVAGERNNVLYPFELNTYNTIYAAYTDSVSARVGRGITVDGEGSNNNQGVEGNGFFDGDPNIEDMDWQAAPRWWDGQLWPTSPMRNRGRPNAPWLPATDVVGRPRTLQGTPDIGAWEHDPAVNVEPRADPVTARLLVPVGEPFTFDGSAAFDPDGEIVSAFWTISDGTLAPGLSVEHVFAADGPDREGYLTVVDDQGAEDHARVIVELNQRPVADAGPDVFQDEGPGEDVFFDGAQSRDPDGAIVAYAWDFGDGSPPSDLVSPRHGYASAGYYVATLTVTDDEGFTHRDTAIATVYGALDLLGPLVEHTPPPDGQPVGEDIVIRARVRDPAGVQSVVLFYRPIGDAAPTFALMQPVGGNDYEAVIPAAAVVEPGVEYWFIAQDALEPDANTATAPLGAPAAGTYDVLVVADRDAPTIEHDPVVADQPLGEPVALTAAIRDETGVDAAVVFYRRGGDPGFAVVNMVRGDGDTWRAEIPGAVVGAAGVQYYIAARDAAPYPRLATSPPDAPASLHRFGVITGDRQPPTLVHTPVADGRPEGEPVTVRVGVVDSDSAIDTVTLAWRPIGAADDVRIAMQRVGGSNTWQAIIPGAAVAGAGVEYHLEATDAAGNAAADPRDAPATRHRFTVRAPDRLGPVITHAPVPNGRPEGVDVALTATADDPAGVAAMRVYYRPAGFPITQSAALALQDGVWTGTIPGFEVRPPAVEYYLRATDGEGNHSYAPADAPAAPYAFAVGDVDGDGPVIEHAPVADGRPAGLAVPITVTATDPSGVADVTVHHRPAGAPAFEAIALAPGPDDTWTGALPAAAIAPGVVEYVITARDGAAFPNEARLPAAPGEVLRFTVDPPDLAPPAITHDPDPDPLALGAPLTVAALVTDESPIDAVTLRWAIDDGPYAALDMQPGTDDDTWLVTLDPAPPPGAVEIRYLITATDAAGNTAVAPPAGEDDPYRRALDLVDRDPPDVALALAELDPPLVAGQPATFTITATDAAGAVADVELALLLDGRPALTIPAEPAGPDTWRATVLGAFVAVDTLHVAAYATDDAGNVGDARLVLPVVPPPDQIPPRVTLDRVPDGQPPGTRVTVTATIVDDVGVARALLHVRPPGANWSVGDMVALGGGVYRATIPAGAVIEPAVDYYVSATDVAGNRGTDPDADILTPARFTVGLADLDGPTVEHTPPPAAVTGEPLALAFTVADPSGVAAVRVRWRTGDDPDHTLAAAALVDGAWRVTLPDPAPPAVEYHVEADDTRGNTTRHPQQGDLRVDVTPPDLDPPAIEHTPPPEALVGAPLPIEATVTDPGGVARVEVRHRVIGALVFATTPLVAGPDDTWTGALPGVAVAAPGVEYHLTAVDARGNTARDPAGVALHRVAVAGADIEPPALAHTPPAGPAPEATPLALTVTAADDSGVAGVIAWYRGPGAPAYRSIGLVADGDTWRGALPAEAIAPPAVEYYFVGIDALGNTGALPPAAELAPYRVAVGAPPDDLDPPRVVTAAVADGAPRAVAVPVDATITDAGGVASATLYARPIGAPDYAGLPMNGVGDAYRGVIPAGLVEPPGVEYYVEARDLAGNSARDPVGGPLRFLVDPGDLDAPVITHTPPDPILAGDPLSIEATVTDPGGVTRVTLYSRPSGAGAYQTLDLDPLGGDRYAATLAAVPAPGVDYYLRATDAAGNVALAPLAGPDAPYTVDALDPPDETPPLIAHDPLRGPLDPGDLAPITATVTDDALTRVEVRYRLYDDDAFATLPLAPLGGDRYSAALPAWAVAAPGFEYHLEATDAAGNVATDPPDAPATLHRVDVRAPDLDGPAITLDALPERVSAGTPVPVAATITDPSGVVTARLHVYSPATESWSTTDLVAEPADRYTRVIAAVLVAEPELLVYLDAEDALGNTRLDPPDGPDAPYAIAVDPAREADPPTIAHAPPADGLRDAPLPIDALVTDASGVADVIVAYREAGAAGWTERALTPDGDRWAGEIPADATAGDAVEYHLVAIDTLDNAAADPADAPAAWHTVALVDPAPDLGPDLGPEADLGTDLGPESDLGPDLGPESDLGSEPDAEADPDPDFGGVIDGDAIIPGNGADMSDADGDDGEPTGCACDVDDGGAPAPLCALLALLALTRRRRSRRASHPELPC